MQSNKVWLVQKRINFNSFNNITICYKLFSTEKLSQEWCNQDKKTVDKLSLRDLDVRSVEYFISEMSIDE